MKPRILSTARLRSFLSIAGSSLLAISCSHAADGTWTRTTAGPFDWENIANWSSGAGPITITSSNGTPGIGTYTLLSAPGGITGSVPTVSLPGGWTGTASIDGNDLRINITTTGGGGSACDTWKAANAPDSNPDDVTVKPTVPQAPDAKKFARLKVVITP